VLREFELRTLVAAAAGSVEKRSIGGCRLLDIGAMLRRCACLDELCYWCFQRVAGVLFVAIGSGSFGAES